MKLIDIVAAREPLQKLVLQDLPVRTAYELMDLTETCNRHLAFYGQEIGKFDPVREPERLEELDGLDVADVIRIRIPFLDGIRLSASDVRRLLPLIEFIQPEQES